MPTFFAAVPAVLFHFGFCCAFQSDNPIPPHPAFPHGCGAGSNNLYRYGGSLCRHKVHNNDVWKIHQRAYKKYFARTKAGTMTKPEFEEWSREAECLRDDALAQYEKAITDEARKNITEKLKRELNNR